MTAKKLRAKLTIGRLSAATVTMTAAMLFQVGFAVGMDSNRSRGFFGRNTIIARQAPIQCEGALPRPNPLSEAKQAAKEKMDKAYQAYQAAEANYKAIRNWNLTMEGRAPIRGLKPLPQDEVSKRLGETRRAYEEARRIFEQIPN